MTRADVEAGFHRVHGRPPTVVVRAPGRVNLIGDHTDYQGGLALPMAIPEAVWVAAAPRMDGRVRAASTLGDDWVDAAARDLRGEAESSEPQVNWRGFIRGALALTDHVGGADVWVDADLPAGAGLSSSAAVGLGLLSALDALGGARWTSADLVRLGRLLENRYLGVASGLMDEMAVVHARSGSAVLVDAGRETATPVPFPYAEGGQAVWIIDSGSKRRLGESAYGERVAETAEAARLLGVASLSTVPEGAWQDLRDPLLRRRARHVLTENARVVQVVEASAEGRWREVRDTFLASHASLRDDFDVSVPALDVAVETLETVGCGARVTGAGFGGSLVAIGPAGVDAELRAVLGRAYARHGWAGLVIRSVAAPGEGLARLE